MTQSNPKLKAAQVRWELKLTVLQEEERRLFSMLEEQSRESAALPQDMLDRLKAARSQCNEAFKQLMGAIEDRVTHVVSTHAVDRQDDVL
jgi:predicted nuclease with TOPRIM domain